MTKREKYMEIKKLVEGYEEYVAFIDAEVARIDARTAATAKKRAEKTAGLAEEITKLAIEVLKAADRPITLPELVGGTAARVVYYIKPLVEDGTIIKEKAKVGDRKVMTYALAE